MSLPSSALAPVSGADWPMTMALALTPLGCACAAGASARQTAARDVAIDVLIVLISRSAIVLEHFTPGQPVPRAQSVKSLENRQNAPEMKILLAVDGSKCSLD